MPVPSVAKWLEQRTDLSPAGIEYLELLVENWSVLADLAFSDLVLWVPTWNEGGLLAVGQVRAATAPTSISEDLVGVFSPRGRNAQIDRAAAQEVAVVERDPHMPLVPGGIEAYPVRFGGSTIAVLARYPSPSPRVAGQLEQVYLESADLIFSMITHGLPWLPEKQDVVESWDRPRVGDGLIRLDADGIVNYASPNAIGGFRRLGLATALVGQNFRTLVKKLDDSPTGVSRALEKLSTGGKTGFADINGSDAIIMVSSIAMLAPESKAATVDVETEIVSTLLILKDVTTLRSHQRALMSKDATIKEINHRVKNNLQMVNSVLRLQMRRAQHQETKDALTDAQQRINAIAAIHDVLSRDIVTVVDVDELTDSIISVATFSLAADGVPAISVKRIGNGGVLPTTIATPLAMSISELLHNALEHAHADNITVEFTRDGPDLICAVIDDGIGFDAEPGLGLSIVSELVTKELQGTFAVMALGESGTKAQIIVRLPRAGSKSK